MRPRGRCEHVGAVRRTLNQLPGTSQHQRFMPFNVDFHQIDIGDIGKDFVQRPELNVDRFLRGRWSANAAATHVRIFGCAFPT